ncbi:nuclease-related domain-containing protein [Virgibacillus flavescens]|uniref:nuclease-related domain-containing protein n=1 Tax=Virgibacillus flavescens TaxID=1611422 RepID=UPI003D32D843
MIIKWRTTPIEIHVLEALTRRLPRCDRRIEEDLAFCQKGYEGEKKVDRFTNSLLKNNFTILHDVYIQHNGASFQIDTLIIGPYCIFVVEIKNYAGEVTFDFNLNQFTRELNGKLTGFRNPIIQATTNSILLTEWLTDHEISDVPIYSLVALSDPSTILKILPENSEFPNEVMHGEYLAQYILKEKGNPHGYLHQKIGAVILNECGTFNFDYKHKYKIECKDILCGVQCPTCGRLGMKRIHNKWICEKCSITSAIAHQSALTDYLLLIKPWITNSECMRFLGFNSKNVATKLLKEQKLKYDKDRRRWHL